MNHDGYYKFILRFYRQRAQRDWYTGYTYTRIGCFACPRENRCRKKSKKIRSVLSEICVIVTVEKGFTLIGEDQSLTISLTVSIVFGSPIGGPVGRLMDERSGPGIGADAGGSPEATTEEDLSESRGNCQKTC